MPRATVEIEDVVKRFVTEEREVLALDHFSATIDAGTITGLVGPDGAGKTTLMRLIMGLLVPDQGRLRVAGFDSVTESAEIHRRAGYMPQRFGLYEDLSVAQNMALHADLQGLPEAEQDGRFAALLGFTGLAPFTDRLAGQLSGGMKQKLGLACTLINPPEVLLLDEPSVGVDPLSRRELWSIVRGLAEDGMTILWSTAYLDEAERCETVLTMHEGRLLDQGPPARFRKRVAGRTFAMRLNGGDKRALQRRARASAGVLDALIQGASLRLVMEEGAAPPTPKALGGGPKQTVEPVAPRFEDAFIAAIKTAGDEAQAATDTAKPPTVKQSANGGPVIETHDLVRAFGDFVAVDGVNFEVRRGEIFGLLGPNGAGKSTIFKMLCGLLPPSGGGATVAGIDMLRAPAVARESIGYMAQKFSLYGSLSVRQNLEFYGGAYGLAGDGLRRRVGEAIEEFGLGPYAGENADDLPLGFKQRLSLAAALLHRPSILFLDEPTSGVDPLTRREFWRRINDMADAGVTVLVTSHFMDEAEYCDRLAIVYRGQIVATGSPDEFKAEHAGEGSGGDGPTLEDAFVALIENYDEEHPL